MAAASAWTRLSVLWLLLVCVSAAANIQDATVDVRKWERTSMYLDEPNLFIATWTIKFNQAIGLKRREGKNSEWSLTADACNGVEACELSAFQTPADQRDPFALPVITEAGLEGISMRIECGNVTMKTRDAHMDHDIYRDPCMYQPGGCQPYPYDYPPPVDECPQEICADVDLDDPATFPTSCFCTEFPFNHNYDPSTGMGYTGYGGWYETYYDSAGDGGWYETNYDWPTFLISPVSNALPRFVQHFSNVSYGEPTYKIFDEEAFADDTLILGSVIGFEFPGADEDATMLVDVAKCQVIFGDDGSPSTTWDIVSMQGTADNVEDSAPIERRPVECSVAGLSTTFDQFEFVLDKMSTASTEQAFSKGVSTLSIIKITDGFSGCVSVLERMIDTEWQDVAVPDSRACVAPRNSTEWAQDPCCNKALAFSQCCAPRDISVWALRATDGVKEEELSGSCSAVPQQQQRVENAIISYVQMINDEGECSKVREGVTPESMEQMMAFWQTCEAALFEGKTKAGADACSTPSECWTNKCEEEKCVAPKGFEWERAFLQCAVENMEPVLLNTFRKNVDAQDGDSLDAVVEALTNKLAEEDCYSGGFAGAAGGKCMIDASQEQCESNIFANHSLYVNFSASEEECLAMGEDYMWSTAQVIDWDACGGRYNSDDDGHDDWWDGHDELYMGDENDDWWDEMGYRRHAASGKRSQLVQRSSSKVGLRGHNRRSHDFGHESDPWAYFDWTYGPSWYGSPSYDLCNVTRPLGCVNTGAQCTTLPELEDGTAEPEDPYENCEYYNDFDFETGEELETGRWECWDVDSPWWYDDWYDPGMYYGGAGQINAACTVVDSMAALSEMQRLFEQQQQKYVTFDASLSTRWLPVSPVQPKCEVVTSYWWSVNHMDPTCDANCQCDEMRAFLSTVHGWNIPAESSAWLQYGNVYSYVWDWDSADYLTELVAPGNKAYCEMEQACNWNPADESMTEAECLAQDKGFCCGNEEGGLCWEKKTEYAACYLNDVDEQACARRGGSMDAFRTCILPDRETAEACWDAPFCPINNWEWWGYESGFCEQYDFCYTESVDNEADCVALRGEGEDWPQWYEPWSDNLGYYSEGNWDWGYQEFYPETAICVQGLRGWHQPEGIFTLEQCEEAGHQFWAKRSFREGMWDSEDACKVCSENPWDPRLAQDEQECLDQRGYCSRNCAACESSYWSQDSVCIATNISTAADCEFESMTWVADLEICIGGYWGGGICEARDDKRILRCRDVEPESCTPSGLADMPMYNGDHPNELLDCRVTDWGVCETKEECEGSGECDDWELSQSMWYWDAYNEVESETAVCVVPFDSADAWGFPRSSACEKAQDDGYYNSWNEYRLGCIIHGAPVDYCEDLGGTSERRAQTEEECLSRSGCFNKDSYFVTMIGEDQCAQCEEGTYEWVFPYRWTVGQWTNAYIQDLEWMEPAMVPKNVWRSSVRFQDLERLVRESMFEIVGEVYASEAQCKLRPYFDALQTIACGCGAESGNSGSNDAFCTDVFDLSKAIPMGKKTLWTNFEGFQYIRGGALGSVRLTQDTVRRSASNRDNVQGILARINGFNLRISKTTRRRNTRGEVSCSDFEVIPNADGDIIGQLVGNGVQLSGLGQGAATFCVPQSSAFPTCLAKYPVLDFAPATSDNKPGVPLQVQVTENSGGQYCAEIDLEAGATTTVFPVLRTRDLQPFQPFLGQVVRRAMALDIQAKELFTPRKQEAFRKSVADALSAQSSALALSLSPDDILIEKICDSAGCLDLLSSRRADATGITVTYQIQGAEGVDMAAVESALDDASFAATFEQHMASNGVPVSVGAADVIDDTDADDDSEPADKDIAVDNSAPDSLLRSACARASALALAVLVLMLARRDV